MTKVTAGQILAAARLEAGRDLACLAQETCIRTGILRAIEENDVDALPARAFAIGFVRSYAQALKLDADAVVALFKTQLDGEAESQPDVIGEAPVKVAPAIVAARPVRTFGRRVTALAGTLTVFVLASAALMLSSGRDDARSVAAPQPKGPSLVREAAAPASTRPAGIVLKADEDVWIRLSRDGETVYEGVLAAGSAYTAPKGGALKMDASNAHALVVMEGGETVARFDGDADVVRDITL